MAQRRPRDQRAVGNRRVAIHTFLLILTLFRIPAHRTVQKEWEPEALRVGTAAEGPGGQVKELAEGWPRGMPEEVVGRQTGGQPKEPVQEQPEGLPGAWIYKGRGEINTNGGLKILPEDMQCLILTNTEYPVPEDYEVGLGAISSIEQSVDKGTYGPLMTTIGDMKDQGSSPIVCSDYRALDKQEKLFNRKVLSFAKAGHTKEEPYNLARQTMSVPGSGEHCLGLVMGFYTGGYHRPGKAFEDTSESKWPVEHAQDYGSVMRYGENKTDITGIRYEPWRYRYIGVEAVNYMKGNELPLKEFYIEQSLYD